MGKSDSYTDLMTAWWTFNTRIMTEKVSVGLTVIAILIALGAWIHSRGKAAGKAELRAELAKQAED